MLFQLPALTAFAALTSLAISTAAPITHTHAQARSVDSSLGSGSGSEKRQDVSYVYFTGYWPEENAWKEVAGYNLGWTGGSGEYTLSGTLQYPNYETGLNESTTTAIFDSLDIDSYIYHFGLVDTYPAESTFQFKIQDSTNPDLYDESPALPIIPLA